MDYTKYKLGVIPSPQDTRDYKVSMFYGTPPKQPDFYQIAHLPRIYDQGEVGQCVAFSLAAIKESHEWLERISQQRYATSFIYGNRGQFDYQGEGMIPRQAMARLVQSGVPEWSEMPWVKEYPQCREYVQTNLERLLPLAKPQKIEKYYRIYNPEEGMTALINGNAPILYCIAVYPSFYNVDRSTGIVHDVQPYESILGYHAMVAVGWDTINGRKYWIVHNSWSTNWGKNGICLIPFDYKGFDEAWGLTDHNPTPRKTIVLTIDSKDILINGFKASMDVAPFIKDNRTFVPVRFVAEAMDMRVTWDDKNRQVIIEMLWS